MKEPLVDRLAAVEQRGDQTMLLWSVLVQLLALLLMLVRWWLQGGDVFRSLLLGALAFAIPYCWFAWYTFLTLRMEAPPDRKMQRLYRGEAQKFLMTAVLCGVVFVKVHPLDAAGFFSAFVAMMVLGWALPAWLKYKMDSGVNRV
jgi:ATP synthase protein I